ncbi:hypothetical protein HELRODRAFT_177885 [Helobdella robusta]|uniref:WSC domain-containing protein n=1 Tax=Helobdella robusta TaxID=6412 RepID=T1FCF1_HELRO|nr:hypothetical protein HELRODRAFT_177885 [Helobdella robusta]ESN97464.1 hypothetical protein HELRODRAFT_177885 [Helobdella robusta]
MARQHGAWIVVDLVGFFNVDHVLLYGDQCKCHLHNSNKFIVGLNKTFDPLAKKVRGKYKICGTYRQQVLCTGQPVRADCTNVVVGGRTNFRLYLAKFVVVQRQEVHSVGGLLRFREIEVYSDISTKLQYIGCYEKFKSSIQFSVLTHQQCVNQCLLINNDGSFNFALRYSDDELVCHCGQMASDRIPSTYCSHICPDERFTCGGKLFYSVYSSSVSFQSFVGCFRDEMVEKTAHHVISDNNNITSRNNARLRHSIYSSCLNFCGKHNAKYFAIKAAHTCICTDALHLKELLPYQECNQRCPDYDRNKGDDVTNNNNYYYYEKSCGFSRGYSLYTVRDSKHMDSRLKYNFCVNTDKLSYLKCVPGRCEVGWKGILCDIRDCSQSLGACPAAMRCINFFVGGVEFGECLPRLDEFSEANDILNNDNGDATDINNDNDDVTDINNDVISNDNVAGRNGNSIKSNKNYVIDKDISNRVNHISNKQHDVIHHSSDNNHSQHNNSSWVRQSTEAAFTATIVCAVVIFFVIPVGALLKIMFLGRRKPNGRKPKKKKGDRVDDKLDKTTRKVKLTQKKASDLAAKLFKNKKERMIILII